MSCFFTVHNLGKKPLILVLLVGAYFAWKYYKDHFAPKDPKAAPKPKPVKEADMTQLSPKNPEHDDHGHWENQGNTLPRQSGGPHSFENPVFQPDSMQNVRFERQNL